MLCGLRSSEDEHPDGDPPCFEQLLKMLENRIHPMMVAIYDPPGDPKARDEMIESIKRLMESNALPTPLQPIAFGRLTPEPVEPGHFVYGSSEGTIVIEATNPSTKPIRKVDDEISAQPVNFSRLINLSIEELRAKAGMADPLVESVPESESAKPEETWMDRRKREGPML